MTILKKPSLVRFDPSNTEHKRAISMIETGKQHPTLRFILEDTYRTVPEMMADKIGTKPVSQWELLKIGRKVTTCQ